VEGGGGRHRDRGREVGGGEVERWRRQGRWIEEEVAREADGIGEEETVARFQTNDGSGTSIIRSEFPNEVTLRFGDSQTTYFWNCQMKSAISGRIPEYQTRFREFHSI
jgi:hypothetical protein